MWRRTTCQRPAPSALARSTYNRRLAVSTWARMMRAVPGHDVTAMTITMFHSDRSSTAASTMASGRNGMTRNQSVRRISTRVDPPPEEAGGDADDGADHDRQQRRRRPDEQADPRSPHELGGHRPSEVVGAHREVRLGDAHTGLMIESTALSPDCGLIDGASRAMAMNPASTTRPIIAKASRRNAEPKPRTAATRRARTSDRGESAMAHRASSSRTARVTSGLIAGRSRPRIEDQPSRVRSATRLRMITDALLSRNRPWSIGKSGPRIASSVA